MLDEHFRDGEAGVVYTPMETARQIMAELPDEQFAEGKRILDACCGAGNLLVAIIERRLALGLTPEQVAETTFGVDIDAEAIAHARRRAKELLGDLSAIEKNIRVEDFLGESTASKGLEQQSLF